MLWGFYMVQFWVLLVFFPIPMIFHRIIIAILVLFAVDSTIHVIAKGKTLSEANTNAAKANTEMVKFTNENHLQINASKT
jgi:hypothetical protein